MKNLEESKVLTDLLSPGMTMMVATASPTGILEARPLTIADVSDDAIRVLVDTSAAWAQAVEEFDEAHVTVSDNRKNVWASLSVFLEMSSDEAEINELWNPAASAYFDNGRDSAGIGVLHMDVITGAYWTSPSGRLGSIFSMIRAKIGDPSDSGEHGQVEV
jgi:general stress protein 26